MSQARYGQQAGAHSSAGFFGLRGWRYIIPLWEEVLADTETPVSLYLKLGVAPYSYLLESVEGGEKLGRYSFIGLDPLLVFRCRGFTCTIWQEGKEETFTDPLGTLKELLQELQISHYPSDLPRFFGGLVGYFSYDFVRYLERIPITGKNDLQLPEAYLVLNRVLLIYDHVQRTVKVVCLARHDDPKDRSIAQERLNKILRFLNAPPKLHLEEEVTYRWSRQSNLISNMTPQEFMTKVGKIKDYIAAGDCIQVVLSQRLELPFQGNPFGVYRRLRSINPSPYMFYLHFPEVKLVGSSPEMLVRVEDGLVETRPIAGTRRRGRDLLEDQKLAQELQANEKERAEHLMLLDLGRNDIGRVAVPGSVQVPQFMTVEYYSHVMHLVSSVTGRLAPGKTALDAFLACFPAGTVSGAPKVRAMEIIAELEPTLRGPYAGAVGYLGLNGNLDTCIAIRTIIFTGGKAFVQTGAGIVADSVPEAEYQETLNKARALLKALENKETARLKGENKDAAYDR
ncbi:anthranilate synthase, component I [Thermanaeromonas toyohensis ToBE]|uniref:Anthranilate synthase component 1 n=1 Tax=Thermanaeromonas toyohensis ToBE TaxID=698762 RepID=A0A1W1VY88_9FIRM|nr:anthranilate synthase component I [Thermanaeromonas toyohensis]SMB98352.1 anthranilate synthase, component I [Thermanaeromonas toyohensis ToBE]